MSQLDTTIDRLVEFIRLKKSTTVEEASKALSLSAKQVEEIAEILAESGLIHLKYEFSGIRLTPQLVDKAAAKSAGEERRKKVLERLIEIHAEIESVKGMVEFSQKDVDRRLESIREHFREIEELDLKQENLEELKRRIEELLAELGRIQQSVEQEQKKSTNIREEMKRFSEEVDKQRGHAGTGIWKRLKKLLLGK